MHQSWGRRLLFLCTVSSLLMSCVNTKKTVYFNNIQDTILKQQALNLEPTIAKSDLLNITVTSSNSEASVIFNTPNMISAVSSTTSGTTGTPNSVGAPQFTGYLVNSDGDIKFPILGKVKVEGLTKRQLEDQIADSLLTKKLLIDPIVSVRFLNFRVTVLGEVTHPTTINVINERISILEALGLAGDLTIYGKRENVLLIRENGPDKIIQRIDLNSENILTSPFYYLKTNDIIYVEPNRAKIANSSRTQQMLPIILSAMSFIAIIVSYWVK